MTMRYNAAPSHRQLKVSEEIRKHLSEMLLRQDISDAILDNAFISITDVRISRDLKLATIFFTHITGKTSDITKVLTILTPSIRKILSTKMNLKFAPQIRFVFDKTIDQAIKIEKLLREER